MKFATTIVIVFVIFGTVYAQKEDHNWVFGDNCGLNFNTDPPENFTAKTRGFELSATISDSIGNLVTYLSPFLDSASIRNISNNIIVNGGGINTNRTFADGAIFIPVPNKNNQYYLFHVGNASQHQDTILLASTPPKTKTISNQNHKSLKTLTFTGIV